VFDVTSGRKYYGPEGGYHIFAGRDAADSMYTGCFKVECLKEQNGKPRTPEQQKEVEDWITFYSTHKDYFRVGTIAKDQGEEEEVLPVQQEV
jgi:hypothetical protein